MLRSRMFRVYMFFSLCFVSERVKENNFNNCIFGLRCSAICWKMIEPDDKKDAR